MKEEANMKKKMMIVLSTLLLVSTLLGGCSKGGNAAGTGAGTEEVSQAVQAVETVVKEIEADPTAIALAKELLAQGTYSQTELIKALGKVSVPQNDAKLTIEALGIDFKIQALKTAINLAEGKFPTSRIESLLGNSGYSEEEIAFAMENLESSDAASLIEEEMAKFEITDEEAELLSAVHGN